MHLDAVFGLRYGILNKKIKVMKKDVSEVTLIRWRSVKGKVSEHWDKFYILYN